MTAALLAQMNNKTSFDSNSEYLEAYVDLIYLRAVVGGMISFAEQTSFQDLLESGKRRHNDYEDYGVNSRSEFMDKLRLLKKHLLDAHKKFHTCLDNSDCSKFYLERIGKEYNLSRAEIDIIAVAYAVTNTSRFERLGRTNGFTSCSCNEVHDALIMLGHTANARLKLKPFFGPGSKLVQSGLINLYGRATTENDFLNQNVELSRRICAQIQGVTEPDDAILAFARLITPEVTIDRVVYDEEKKQTMLNLIRNHKLFAQRRKMWNLDTIIGYGFGTTMLFGGSPGTGKTLMAQALAKECGLQMLQVSVPDLFRKGNFEENFQLVMQEASLQEQVLLFFDEADELFSDRNINGLMPLILREFERFSGVCILATNRKQMLDEAMDRRILYKADFETPGADARREIWKQHLPAELPLADDIDFDELAKKFTFSGGYIKNAVVLACHHLAAGLIEDNKLHQATLMEAAQCQRTSQLERLTERVVPSTRLEDVVLNDEQKHAVEAIINEYRNRDTVFSKWGFGDIMPYGKGTIALLHGPSGSGKTMTANAIAHELGLNLINVSANHVVSSYVGESAQRIHEIFARAKEEEAIILFDEAESIFSARTTENGSNAAVNRDNNQQVTVLLREIEKFNGIVLLTSNHITGDNMDKAFARRIRHHIGFEAPTLELRSQIWRKHFPGRAPLADDVDFNALAESYDFSGGTIKQIALKAAFEAASGKGIITRQMLFDLCEFEITHNKVGFRKTAAPVGFGR